MGCGIIGKKLNNRHKMKDANIATSVLVSSLLSTMPIAKNTRRSPELNQSPQIAAGVATLSEKISN